MPWQEQIAENFPQIQDADNLIGLNSTVPAPLLWLINHNTNASNVSDGVMKVSLVMKGLASASD